MAEMETRTLFLQFLNISNTALRAHRDHFPYRQILELGDRGIGGRNIGVAIRDARSGKIRDYFTVRYGDGTFDVVEHGKEHPEAEWELTSEYLEHVVQNADDYMRHPEKLEWDWLKRRLGIGAS